jgi:peptidoglycan/xylan/chitin deacetylase (PgdA/CDA1 family)
MNKPCKILIITIIALTMFAVEIPFTGNLTKAQSTSGIVTLVFDDGWNSQFNNAFPLMQEHGFVGTYYIITSCVGSGDYMNMSDLQTLQATGNEIASHSVTHPIFTNLTDSQINYECNASKQFLQNNGFPATNFAYPYGYSNSNVDSIVLQYYRSARYSAAGGYLMPIPPTSIQMSIPMGFPGETGDSTALAKNEEIVRLAQETNSWVIIFFHNILSTPLTTPWEIERSNFAEFLNYLGNSSVQVKTINQVLNLWSSPQRVTVFPSSTTMDVGQGQTFTASAYGGTSPYTYKWFLGGNSVGTNSPSYTFDPSSAGLFSIFVNATDSSGVPVTVKSNNASVTVYSAPTVSVSPTTWVMDVGQSRTFTASALGGSGSYTNFQWYVGGFAQSGAIASTFSYSPGSVGSYLITVTVTDSLGVTSVQSSAASVTVNPALVTPTLSVSAFTVNRGQTSNFTSSAFSTGTSPYTYQWLQKDPIGSFLPISGATSNSYSFDASIDTAFGSWSFELRVTDATGAQVTSSFISVVLNPIISVFASAGGSIIPAGNVNVNYGSSQSFTIKANANYYIIDVSVNGSSVGSVNSYTFNNIQDSYGIFATFAPEPTLSPSPTATPISTPIPTSTLMPPIEGHSTPSPIPVASPTTSSTTTPHPTPSSRYTQSPTVPKFSIFTLSILIMSILVLAVAARKKQARI